MARKVVSPELRLVRAKRAHLEVSGKKRARHLYNLLYRKSRYYRASVFFRLFSISLCIYIVYLNSSLITSEKEILSKSIVDDTHFFYKTGTKDHKNVVLSTTAGNTYKIDFLATKPEVFFAGDTISVFKNVFGKKTFVSKQRSKKLNIQIRYARCNNFLVFVIGFSLISFLLRDGYDYLSRFILLFVLTVDLIGIVSYILT